MKEEKKHPPKEAPDEPKEERLELQTAEEPVLVLPTEIEEELGKLSGDGRHKLVGFMTQQIIHAGPLPSPDKLRGYEAAYTGAAGRIIDYADKEQDHRQKVELKEINGINFQAIYQPTLATIVILTMIFTGYRLAVEGHEIAAGSVLGTTLVGVAGAFFYSKRSAKEEE